MDAELTTLLKAIFGVGATLPVGPGGRMWRFQRLSDEQTDRIDGRLERIEDRLDGRPDRVAKRVMTHVTKSYERLDQHLDSMRSLSQGMGELMKRMMGQVEDIGSMKSGERQRLGKAPATGAQRPPRAVKSGKQVSSTSRQATQSSRRERAAAAFFGLPRHMLRRAPMCACRLSASSACPSARPLPCSGSRPQRARSGSGTRRQVPRSSARPALAG